MNQRSTPMIVDCTIFANVETLGRSPSNCSKTFRWAFAGTRLPFRTLSRVAAALHGPLEIVQLSTYLRISSSVCLLVEILKEDLLLKFASGSIFSDANHAAETINVSNGAARAEKESGLGIPSSSLLELLLQSQPWSPQPVWLMRRPLSI